MKVEIFNAKSLKPIATVNVSSGCSILDVKKDIHAQSYFLSTILKSIFINLNSLKEPYLYADRQMIRSEQSISIF